MKIGDTIASINQPLLPGINVGWNGTSFDLLWDAGDNADGLITQSSGILQVVSKPFGFNGTTWDRIRAMADNADGLTVLTTGLVRQGAEAFLFNGTSWDRQRNNLDNITLSTLTAASSNSNSSDQTNYNHRGVKVTINITALTGTSPTLTVTIQGKDPVSSQYFNLLATTALNSTGTTVLTVYPGITAASNASLSDILPRTWRIAYTIGGTTPSVTATIASSLVL